MIIAIDTRINNGDLKDDHKNFINKIFGTLIRQHPEHTFIFLDDGRLNITGKNIIIVTLNAKQKTNFLSQINADHKINSLLKKYKANVFLSAQCLMHSNITQLLFSYKNTKRKYLKKADLIITQSQLAKKNLIESQKINDKKIEIIYAAADKNFQKISFEEREKIKEQFAEGNEYFLFYNSISAPDDLINLLKAFSIFKKRQKSSMQLLLLSKKEVRSGFLQQLQLYKYKNDVKVIKAVSENELAKITAAAYAMIFLSSVDGSELSLLQTMQCNVSIIAFNEEIASEICASAALYTYENDFKNLADKLMLIFKDEHLRQQLIKKGHQQIEKFDWDTSAKQLWTCIEKAVG